MSRYVEYDDDSPEAVLAYGRWKNNARRVLKSRRGRAALAEMREALLALPQKRLVSGALCTVGGVDDRLPSVTDAEMREWAEDAARWAAGVGFASPDYPQHAAEMLRSGRDAERQEYASAVEHQGHGVCAIGAWLWHKKVRDGLDPDQAFASLPPLTTPESGDGLRETADLGEDAGLAFTLAWELAYRNDETYARMTPEDRYTAFLGWIDKQLEPVPA